MAAPPAKRVPKMVPINDPVEFCRYQVAGMYSNIYFFDMHFDEWRQAAALPAPQVFAPGGSVCRQYFEYAFPGITFTHDGFDDEGHEIKGSAELIDIHIKRRDLYFFKARSRGFNKGGPDLRRRLLESLPVEHAVRARQVSHAFKDAGQERLLNRLELNYPVTYGYTPEETEAAVQSINQTILPVLKKYQLVRELKLSAPSAILSLMERLAIWPEMHQLLNSTHTLTFKLLTFNSMTASMIDSILRMYPSLRIVIEWLLASVVSSEVIVPIEKPNRVYVQNLVYMGPVNDAFADRLMVKISSLSNHVARVMPRDEYRDGVKYTLSFDTGEYQA